MLDLFEPPKPPAVIHARRVLLLDAAGELQPDLGQIQPRKPSKFDGMSADEIRQYRRLQARARKEGARLVLPLRTAPKVVKAKRPKQTREERNARRRQVYAEQKAAGVIFKQGKKIPYAMLSEEEKQRRRDKQLAWYYANREAQLERAKKKFAALSPEQRAKRAESSRAWKAANRDRVNRQDRERRAAKKAQEGKA